MYMVGDARAILEKHDRLTRLDEVGEHGRGDGWMTTAAVEAEALDGHTRKLHGG